MSERMYPGYGPSERTTFAPYGAFEVPADAKEPLVVVQVYTPAGPEQRFKEHFPKHWPVSAMPGVFQLSPDEVLADLGYDVEPIAETLFVLYIQEELQHVHCGDPLPLCLREFGIHAICIKDQPLDPLIDFLKIRKFPLGSRRHVA